MREVRVELDTGKVLRILSNDLDATAQQIAELYKRRWAIELFFRWVKQTLKIRRFLGTSENAVRIQIAVALIAFLLLRHGPGHPACHCKRRLPSRASMRSQSDASPAASTICSKPSRQTQFSDAAQLALQWSESDLMTGISIGRGLFKLPPGSHVDARDEPGQDD